MISTRLVFMNMQVEDSLPQKVTQGHFRCAAPASIKKKNLGKKCEMRHWRAAALLADYTSELNSELGKYSEIRGEQ